MVIGVVAGRIRLAKFGEFDLAAVVLHFATRDSASRHQEHCLSSITLHVLAVVLLLFNGFQGDVAF